MNWCCCLVLKFWAVLFFLEFYDSAFSLSLSVCVCACVCVYSFSFQFCVFCGFYFPFFILIFILYHYFLAFFPFPFSFLTLFLAFFSVTPCSYNFSFSSCLPSLPFQFPLFLFISTVVFSPHLYFLLLVCFTFLFFCSVPHSHLLKGSVLDRALGNASFLSVCSSRSLEEMLRREGTLGHIPFAVI